MKLTHSEILYMKALESIAKVDAVGCIAGEKTVTFLVRPAQMGLAIGKKGETVKKIRGRIGKNIELFEYAKEPEKFVKRAFKDIKIEKIRNESEGGKIMITLGLDSTNKRKMLQNLSRLKRVREVAKKAYNVENIKIK